MITQHTIADRIVNQTKIKTSLGEFTVIIEMNTTRNVNKMIDAIVWFGNANEPGWRLKDDSESLNMSTGKFEGVAEKRKQVKIEVANKLGIALEQVRGQALYSRFQPCGNGMAKDTNTGGYIRL